MSSDKQRTKRLEAKRPIYYSTGVNAMSPFAVPEQTENKDVGNPVKQDLRTRAVPSMSMRYSPEEALPRRATTKTEKKKAARDKLAPRKKK